MWLLDSIHLNHESFSLIMPLIRVIWIHSKTVDPTTTQAALHLLTHATKPFLDGRNRRKLCIFASCILAGLLLLALGVKTVANYASSQAIVYSYCLSMHELLIIQKELLVFEVLLVFFKVTLLSRAGCQYNSTGLCHYWLGSFLAYHAHRARDSCFMHGIFLIKGL